MDADALRQAPRELSTPRLLLRCPHEDDAQVLMDSTNRSLPNLGFIAWGREAWDLERAKRFCRGGLAMVDAGECLVFHVFRNDEGAYVGRVDMHSFDFETPRAEIGYVGDVQQQGLGLMREAVREVIRLGFAMGLARVQALSEADNHRALHFATTLGLRREAVLRHYERDVHGRLGAR